MSAEEEAESSRVVLGEEELKQLSPEQLGTTWKRQETYVMSLEQRLGVQEGTVLFSSLDR